jgi:hypothetical protein
MENPRHVAPIIAAVLLFLPVLYVGSYLALLVPRPVLEDWFRLATVHYGYTRFGGILPNW